MSDDKSASPEQVMQELEQAGKGRKSRRQLEEEKTAAVASAPEVNDVDIENLVFEKPEGERPEKPAPQPTNPLGAVLKTGNRRGVAVHLTGSVGDSARQFHRGGGTKRVDW